MNEDEAVYCQETVSRIVKRLIQLQTNEQDYMIYKFMQSTGLGIEEIELVIERDINFNHRIYPRKKIYKPVEQKCEGWDEHD